jgi:hypothetical protein
MRRVLLHPAVKQGLAHGRPGRPCKLADPQRRETLLKALEAGNTRKAACAYAGLSEDAFARYCASNPDFTDDVGEAEAKAVIRHVGLILQAANKDWRAAAWWLERKFPDEWGRKNRTILTGADRGPIAVQEVHFDLSKLTDHEYQTLKELYAKIEVRQEPQKLERDPLLTQRASAEGNTRHE